MRKCLLTPSFLSMKRETSTPLPALLFPALPVCLRHRAPSPHSSDKVTNVLFVCSANRLRSPTAEQIFSTWRGVETDSAGISNGASVPLSSEQVEWADIIFVMEKTHRTKLSRKFRSSLKGKRVICLDIPDDYEFMDPALIQMLESRAGRFLPRPEPALPKL
jgi:predicted protein tyrosine phosphatase